MIVRVIYRESGVSVIYPEIRCKRAGESDSDFLTRVFTKATPQGADYQDIEDSELPSVEYRDAWVKNPDGGVMVDNNTLLSVIQQRLESALDTYIDSVAQSKDASGKQRYDNRITACLRASLPNSPWYQQGVAFGEWMDACYAQAYQLMNDVKNGLAEIPTEEELINSLPDMVWPE